MNVTNALNCKVVKHDTSTDGLPLSKHVQLLARLLRSSNVCHRDGVFRQICIIKPGRRVWYPVHNSHVMHYRTCVDYVTCEGKCYSKFYIFNCLVIFIKIKFLIIDMLALPAISGE